MDYTEEQFENAMNIAEDLGLDYYDADVIAEIMETYPV